MDLYVENGVERIMKFFRRFDLVIYFLLWVYECLGKEVEFEENLQIF